VRNHEASSSSPPATSSTQGTSGTGGTSTGTTPTASTPAWKKITIDVLNGYGGTNAAGTAVSTLRTTGFTVGSYGNAGTTKRTNTVVVFTAGHRADAKVIAKKLGLGVIPLVLATGVPQTAVKDGVAIVLGPNWTTKIS
jgi:hypothetical protein